MSLFAAVAARVRDFTSYIAAHEPTLCEDVDESLVLGALTSGPLRYASSAATDRTRTEQR